MKFTTVSLFLAAFASCSPRSLRGVPKIFVGAADAEESCSFQYTNSTSPTCPVDGYNYCYNFIGGMSDYFYCCIEGAQCPDLGLSSTESDSESVPYGMTATVSLIQEAPTERHLEECEYLSTLGTCPYSRAAVVEDPMLNRRNLEEESKPSPQLKLFHALRDFPADCAMGCVIRFKHSQSCALNDLAGAPYLSEGEGYSPSFFTAPDATSVGTQDLPPIHPLAVYEGLAVVFYGPEDTDPVACGILEKTAVDVDRWKLAAASSQSASQDTSSSAATGVASREVGTTLLFSFLLGVVISTAMIGAGI